MPSYTFAVTFIFSNNMPILRTIRQGVSFCLALSFTFFSLNPIGWAQTVLLSPAGTIAQLSVPYTPALLRGIAVNPQDPFKLNFIIDQANCPSDQFSSESQKLIKYFLAAFTIPEKDLWVNLSPDAPTRIIPESLGITDMGRDLLSQDYFLKQLSSSLMSPENELGKKFWERIYQQAKEKYGTTDVPMNALSRVWIRFEGATDIQMLNPPVSLDPAAMIGFTFQIQNTQPITNLLSYLIP